LWPFNNSNIGLISSCMKTWIWIYQFCIFIVHALQNKLNCDNKAATCITHNPFQHDRVEHVEVDRHFIKEKLESYINILLIYHIWRMKITLQFLVRHFTIYLISWTFETSMHQLEGEYWQELSRFIVSIYNYRTQHKHSFLTSFLTLHSFTEYQKQQLKLSFLV
jgi:hypothetical protein